MLFLISHRVAVLSKILFQGTLTTSVRKYTIGTPIYYPDLPVFDYHLFTFRSVHSLCYIINLHDCRDDTTNTF